jgi:hypothetical protein
MAVDAARADSLALHVFAYNMNARHEHQPAESAWPRPRLMLLDFSTKPHRAGT